MAAAGGLVMQKLAAIIRSEMDAIKDADLLGGPAQVVVGKRAPEGLVDLTIRELAALVQRAVGYEGPVEWDSSKPDGTPRKLMDVSRWRGLGWAPTVSLEEGIGRAYEWCLENRG